MFLEFTDHISDSSGNDVFVKNENVQVRDGVAYFNGSARLVIPQFTNAELGNNFGFRIRFKETKAFLSSGLRQSLINNGDCGDLGSVRLTINDNNVEFGLETDGEERPKELSIQKPVSLYNTLCSCVVKNTPCRPKRVHASLVSSRLHMTF